MRALVRDRRGQHVLSSLFRLLLRLVLVFTTFCFSFVLHMRTRANWPSSPLSHPCPLPTQCDGQALEASTGYVKRGPWAKMVPAGSPTARKGSAARKIRLPRARTRASQARAPAHKRRALCDGLRRRARLRRERLTSERGAAGEKRGGRGNVAERSAARSQRKPPALCTTKGNHFRRREGATAVAEARSPGPRVGLL